MKEWIDKNLGIIIIFGTLLVSIPRYAAAFSQAEPRFLGLTIAPITGTGFGVLLELGIYYVIDSWFDARRRGLKYSWLLLIGFAIQLVIAPVIIAPAIVGHMVGSKSELSGVLTWEPARWGWAIVTAAAPALLLAAATAASFMRQPASKKKEDSQQEAKTSKEQAGKARFTCDICGRPFRSQPALNAHQRVHAGNDDSRPMSEPAKAGTRTLTQTLGDLGRTADFLRQLVMDPAQTHTDLAAAMGVAPQTASHHLQKLEEAGLIDRSNEQVKFAEGVVELLEAK